MGGEVVRHGRVAATAVVEWIGGIPWEQVIPAPGQTTQPRVPVLGR